MTRAGSARAGQLRAMLRSARRGPPDARSWARASAATARRRKERRVCRRGRCAHARRGRPPARGRARRAARALGIGHQRAHQPLGGRGDRIQGQPPDRAGAALGVPDDHRQLAGQAPVGGVGGARHGGGLGGGVAEQQVHERRVAPLALARPVGLLLGEALGRLRGELVDVGEDRLREDHERLRRHAGGQPARWPAGARPRARPPGRRRAGASSDRPSRTSPRPRAT